MLRKYRVLKSKWLLHIYIDFLRFPCTNAFLISSSFIVYLELTTKEMVNLMVVGFTMGLNISSKSILITCVNCLATSRALNLSMLPSSLHLILYTYFDPTTFSFCGLGTSSQEFFFFFAKPLTLLP